MYPSYHQNGTPPSIQAPVYAHKARAQDHLVLNYFKSSGGRHSPSDILDLVWAGGNQPPLTSVRRAITNLQKQGKLIKTEETKVGLYGRPEYKWRLAVSSRQGELF